MNEWFVSCQKICWNKVNFRKTVNKGELIESTQDQRAVMWSFMPAFSPGLNCSLTFLSLLAEDLREKYRKQYWGVKETAGMWHLNGAGVCLWVCSGHLICSFYLF